MAGMGLIDVLGGLLSGDKGLGSLGGDLGGYGALGMLGGKLGGLGEMMGAKEMADTGSLGLAPMIANKAGIDPMQGAIGLAGDVMGKDIGGFGGLAGLAGGMGAGAMDVTADNALAAAPTVGVDNSMGIAPQGVGMAPNVGEAVDLSGGVSPAAMAMQGAAEQATEQKNKFDLKRMAEGVNQIAAGQNEDRDARMKSLEASMASANKPVSSLGAGVGIGGSAPAALPAQPTSGAMQAIQGGMQPQGVGIGAQPSVQEMMRRIYGY